MIDARFRPLETRIAQPKAGYAKSPFSGSWQNTLNTLERELNHLKAKDIVIEVDTTLSQIRNDGWPYSNAKITSPGIRLSFQSRHGPLSYTCATYTDYAANIRAVAMTLERLRAVERYGCVKGGEQYKGWAALPPGEGVTLGGDRSDFASVEDAARCLMGIACRQVAIEDVLANPRPMWIEASRKAHPDAGGDAATSARANKARDFIEKYAKVPA